jgi:RsiW-degrading membrane proteinase PrsW (M82 family)
MMQGVPVIPLSPAPSGLMLAHTSKPWKTVRSMLALVGLLFLIANMAPLFLYGLLDADMNGTLGPSDPWLIFGASLCSVPILAVLAFLRRPRLTHLIRAVAHPQGAMFFKMGLEDALQSPTPIQVVHHVVHDSAPLEMPSRKALWGLFFGGVFASCICLFPLLLFGFTMGTTLLFLAILLPAFLIGFSTPVFAWWATLTHYFGLQTSRRLAEWMLIAGMISTVPAIMINSNIAPLVLGLLGLSMESETSLGYGLVLMVSAPVGEELCKAAAVFALARFIDSPRRGFQIGFTVGLGFALLENMNYILMSFASLEASSITFGFTSIIRGIGSIPGHGVWTAISGYAIGCHLTLRRPAPLLQDHDKATTQEVKQWMLLDKKSGQILSASNAPSPPKVLPRWLCAPQSDGLQLPTTLLGGVGLAILGHAMWNGSLWAIGVVSMNLHVVLQLFLMLGWTLFLIFALW